MTKRAVISACLTLLTASAASGQGRGQHSYTAEGHFDNDAELGNDYGNRLSKCFVSSVSRNGKPTVASPAVDLVYLLDGSASMSDEDFKIAKTVVKWNVESLDFTTGSRVGLIQFDEKVIPEWHLNAPFNSKEHLIAAIDAIKQDRGGTLIGAALREAREEFDNPAYGHKLSNAKLVVLITDGISQDNAVSVAAKMRNDGIRIVVVGLGPLVGDRELLNITGGDPRLFSRVTRFSAVTRTLSAKIATAQCIVLGGDSGGNAGGRGVSQKGKAAQSMSPAMDVIYAIDAGYQANDGDMDMAKDFIKKSIDSIDFATGTRVGSADGMTGMYNRPPEWHLNTYDTKEKNIAAAGLMIQKSGFTTTTDTIKQAQVEFDNPAYGHDSQHTKIFVLLTDGGRRYDNNALPAATALRNSGVRILVIGVSQRVDDSQLLSIVGGDRSLYFKVSNFGQLTTSLNENVAAAQHKLTLEARGRKSGQQIVMEQNSVAEMDASSSLDQQEHTTSCPLACQSFNQITRRCESQCPRCQDCVAPMQFCAPIKCQGEMSCDRVSGFCPIK